MTDFDDIRCLTMDCIRNNRKNESIFMNWKKSIRNNLVNIQREFNQHINDYANQFF